MYAIPTCFNWWHVNQTRLKATFSPQRQRRWMEGGKICVVFCFLFVGRIVPQDCFVCLFFNICGGNNTNSKVLTNTLTCQNVSLESIIAFNNVGREREKSRKKTTIATHKGYFKRKKGSLKQQDVIQGHCRCGQIAKMQDNQISMVGNVTHTHTHSPTQNNCGAKDISGRDKHAKKFVISDTFCYASVSALPH